MDEPLSTIWLSQLILVFVALALSAFFSGMEIAFITANKLKIELDKKKDLLSGNILSGFLEKPRKFIATMLVGNNIALVTYSYFAGELLILLAKYFYFSKGMTWLEFAVPEYAPYSSLLVQAVITTVLVLFGGEFIPKALFKSNPNWWLSKFAVPLKMFHIILWIPATFVTWLSKQFVKWITPKGGGAKDEKVGFGKIDLGEYLEGIGENEENKELENEIQILQNALEFADVKARDCMIPRNEICAVEINENVDEVTKIFVETGFSKICVYKESIDHIIGYIHSHELFSKPSLIQHIILPIAIIPEPMAAFEVLELLIKQKRNLAVVLDEFGGTSGILTMEDIVEEIFGEIDDEHDSESLTEKQLSENEFLFSARHEIDYINDKYELSIPDMVELETLSGLIIHYHESIPEKNSVITIENYDFVIQEVSDTKIELTKLIVKEEEGLSNVG